MRDEPIADLLAELGLADSQARRVREALDAAGVTNPRKQRVSVAKLDRLHDVIGARFARLCPSCAARTGADGRELLTVGRRHCERCRGSDNARALVELSERCEAAGLRRLVVVGGSPSLREELRKAGATLQLQLVDGTERRTKAQARRDVAWADVVVICGSTELAHRVSTLYTDDPAAKGKLVTAPRRGLSSILDEARRHVERRAASERAAPRR